MNANHTPPEHGHPAVVAYEKHRAEDAQLRVADAITKFAGSMGFVYAHAVVFAVWMLFLEPAPWQKLTLVVSLEAIFLSAFVMIGQNRQADVARRQAGHDYQAQEIELRQNTELTRLTHALAVQMHEAVMKGARGPRAADGSAEGSAGLPVAAPAQPEPPGTTG